ncbi:ferroxidase fet3 [Coemansia nantahalensis]|uniref:Ferroxidase fet3 n=1 Tax=Coemansia nantahalensis TaxID=2789366 RepID=A0ACC1JRD7_9FUNG|nr:ferroxidase fet3 [Coemansia nantahalensis]KAJ2774168.1 ferroxidase fet3 [Coemansia nantahalensis]
MPLYIHARCVLAVTALAAAALAARVEYDWTITNVNLKMDGVRERRAVAVNGAVPMPFATASLGDTLVLRVRNELDEPTGLHSHGITNNGTNYYDGAGRVTECGIAPGSQMEYSIPLRQTGTYWIHGHHNSQYINGLRGPLIITNPAGEPYNYDEDIVLTFEDWMPKYSTATMEPSAGTDAAPTGTDATLTAQSSEHSCGCEAGGDEVSRGAAEHQSNATTPFDPSAKYPLGVINGKFGEDAPELNFEPDKTYRIRLLNIGSAFMFRFSIGGHEMYIIEADGVATEMQKVDSVVLGVAQRVSVLVRALPAADANYGYNFEIFSDVFPEYPGYNPRAYQGAVLYNDDIDSRVPSTIARDTVDDIFLVPLDRQPLLDEPDMSHDVAITAERGPSGIVQAFVNGVQFKMPERPSLLTAMEHCGPGLINATAFGRSTNAVVVPHMAILELRVLNHDSVAHPMHMHGYFFQIVERGTIGDPRSAVRSAHAPMRRDTTIVPPDTYVRLRIRADNPGVWLMHCHIELHMELGLALTLVTAPERIKGTASLPPDYQEQCQLLDIPI